MTKKKKKVYWKSKWISIKEQIPLEGILVLTCSEVEEPSEDFKGNINQYSDGDWFHKTNKEITWWKIFTPEDLNYFQDLAIKIFFEDLIDDKYKEWNLKEMYDFDFEKLRSWINNRPHE